MKTKSQEKNKALKTQQMGLSEEESDFLERDDYEGSFEHRVRRLRDRKRLTSYQRKFLEEYEAIDARIKNDPDAVLNQALQSLDQGTTLFMRLIHSRIFHGELPKEYNAPPWNKAMSSLTSRITFLNRQLVRLAEDREPRACHCLWFDALTLAEAVARLSAIFPDEFRSMAASSLVMPSLRARSPKFTCDAEYIARQIHLAENHPARDIQDNRTRLGAISYYLVAQMVEKVQSQRREKDRFESSARFRNSKKIFPRYFHPDCRKVYEESWALPDLRGNAKAWWKGKIREMVKQEFNLAMKNPRRNPALWQSLILRHYRTMAQKWHALEKYCLNKMKQIAGETGKT